MLRSFTGTCAFAALLGCICCAPRSNRTAQSNANGANAETEPSFWFAGRARLSTKMKSGGRVPVPCGPLRACMRDVVAAGYEPRLIAALATCANLDAPAWKAEECFPIALGTDSVTGRALWTRVMCGCDCTTTKYLDVFYADVGGPEECACVGGAEIAHQGYYAGCAPPVRNSNGQPVAERRDLVSDFRRHELKKSRHRLDWAVLPREPRLTLLGLQQGDLLLAIDGEAVTQQRQVLTLLERLPAYAPSRLLLGTGSYKRELTFVDAATMRALAQRMRPLSVWNDRVPCRALSSCFTLRVRVDSREYSVDFDPTSTEGTRWTGLAGEIARVADDWVAPVAPSVDSVPCTELRTVPTMFALWLPDRTVRELRSNIPRRSIDERPRRNARR